METGVKMIGSNTELWELIKARKQALCPLGKLFIFRKLHAHQFCWRNNKLHGRASFGSIAKALQRNLDVSSIWKVPMFQGQLSNVDVA